MTLILLKHTLITNHSISKITFRILILDIREVIILHSIKFNFIELFFIFSIFLEPNNNELIKNNLLLSDHKK